MLKILIIKEKKLKSHNRIIKRFFLILFILLFLIFFLIFNEIFALFKTANYIQQIEIAKNSSLEKVAIILKQNKIINSSFLFLTYSKLKKAKVKYGVFELNSSMSYDTILETLFDENKNLKVVAKFNFYEGSNFFKLKQKYSNKFENFDFNSLVSVINNFDIFKKFNFYNFLDRSDIEKAFYPMEGFCSTHTFIVKNNYSYEDIANLIFSKLDETIKMLEPDIKKSELNLWQIFTLASLIQAETSKPENMALVSSVLHNRLKIKKRLECDVTASYANKIKTEMEKDGLIDTNKIDSYNTYKCSGLPAGPICNPGLEALKAALNPAQSDYLFFCIDTKTEKALFAKTFKEHKINFEKLKSV